MNTPQDDKCERLYNEIIAYKETHDGNSPSVRELMASCEISSMSVAVYHLEHLEADGLIEFIRHQSRSIEVVGALWLSPEDANDD